MNFEIDPFWTTFGLAAQGLFFMRFFVQWIHSERLGRSAIPVAFWWFSLAGAAMLLVYAVRQRDLVFMVGPAMGLLIYTRNLMLIRREKHAAAVKMG